MLCTLDVRYLAGLFDGEGTVRVARWEKPKSAHVRYQVMVSIGMTHKPIINAIQKQYGGGLSINKHSARNPKHRDQYIWTVASQTAADFLRDILPFLIVKREEVELALEVQASIDKWKHKLGHRHVLHPERDAIFAYRNELSRRITELKHVRYTP